MTREQARNEIRGWVMTNYGFTLFAVLLPALQKQLELDWPWITLILLVVVAGIAWSHDRAFVRTGLWAQTHAKPDTLDEREREIAHQALATSYRWITVIMLLAIYLIILSHEQVVATWLHWIRPVAPVLAVGLIYAAHTLPAALIGWKELPPAEGSANDVAAAQ